MSKNVPKDIYSKDFSIMTLYNIVSILKSIAASQPNIRTTTDGSVYDALNTNPAIQYDVFHISQTNHREDENYDYYGFNLFYISRLEDSLENNRLQIQSIGKEVLSNIIRTLCENFAIDYPTITYFPFTQRFNDLCAGVYCSLQLDVPKELWCADDYVAEVVPGSGIKLQDIGITITENGLRVITADAEYDGIGEIRIETNVPQSAAVLQDKEVEYTENGSYSIHPDPAYDGLSSVSVDVLVPDNYDEGYDDGKRDGEAEQKAKLTVTSFTENNTYTRENGWSAVTVDVPSDYQEGYDDGAADQKAKLVPTAITENGTYSREDGYSSIEVNVPKTGQTINNQEKWVHFSPSQAEYNLTWMPDLQAYATSTPVRVSADTGYTGIEPAIIDIFQPATEAIALGEQNQRAKLVTTAITQNGTYAREDGYSSIEVNVPQGQGYDEGFNDGEEAQKAKMVSTAFTQNGTYSREDGYSAITVNVDDRYDEGYDDGYKAGAAACSGLLATAITLNVASAITDSGTATTTYSPSTAYTDIYYTSSDSTIATINENTGVITVRKSGTVTICTKDRMSGLQDCKSVVVSIAEPSLNMPLTMHIVQAGNIVWKTTDASFATTIQYKKNDGNWTNITSTTGGTPIEVNAGDTVWFRGNNAQYSLGGSAIPGFSIPAPYNTFSGTTAVFELSNNIMSLINSSNFANLKTFQSAYTFCGLFDSCTGLTNAENLLMPATALTNYCYTGMFFRCRGMVSAPSLPATNLATACYEEMFHYCVKLKNAPAILPALTLKSYCYSWMFTNCTELVTAPELPAKTLVDHCYLHMFDFCPKLQTIKCLATNISAERCTKGWVDSVAATGVFTKAAEMSSWTRGEDGIPTGWTVSNNS